MLFLHLPHPLRSAAGASPAGLLVGRGQGLVLGLVLPGCLGDRTRVPAAAGRSRCCCPSLAALCQYNGFAFPEAAERLLWLQMPPRELLAHGTVWSQLPVVGGFIPGQPWSCPLHVPASWKGFVTVLLHHLRFERSYFTLTREEREG